MSSERDLLDSAVDIRMHLGRFWLDPHKIIYGTIMLMVAYAIYDEGQGPLDRGPLFELIGVSFAPLFALGMAHAFSEALDFQITHGRRLTWADRRGVIWENAKFLLIAIPPILIMTVLTILSWDARTIVEVIQLLGLLSLAFWGAFAARKARLGALRQITFALSYGFMGLFVIAVEIALTH